MLTIQPATTANQARPLVQTAKTVATPFPAATERGAGAATGLAAELEAKVAMEMAQARAEGVATVAQLGTVALEAWVDRKRDLEARVVTVDSRVVAAAAGAKVD